MSTVAAANPCKSIVADKSARREYFRTRTIIREENGKKVVYKCAASEKAKRFVKGIVAKERANAVHLKGHFDVHCGTLEQDCIKYDYLPYPSLADRMQLHMQEGNFEAAQDLLHKYAQKIEALETTFTVPEEFLMLVTNEGNYTSKTNCLCRGLLDLTPKNILLNGNRWILLDNEWSFDFPIPIVFVLFRAIRELAFTLQGEIRRITNQDIPALGVFAKGLNTYYIPLVWVKYIINTNIGSRRMVEWEAGFWRYTTGAKREYVGRIKRRPSLRTHFPAWSIEFDSRIITKIMRFVKSMPGVAKIVHILDQ